MRTLVDIGDSEIRALDELAKRKNISRAAVIRDAIDGYLAEHAQQSEAEAFGLWADQKVDGLAYQEDLRSEW